MLTGQEDKAEQPRKTEKEQPGRWVSLGKRPTVSNNADRLNEVEACCDLEKQFQWNSENKKLDWCKFKTK